MLKFRFILKYLLMIMLILGASASDTLTANTVKKQIPSRVPVRVAEVRTRTVSEQIRLVGTTEPIAKSTIAAEVSGVVEYFPIKEGDFVKKGAILVRLGSTGLKLRLKAAIAAREKVKANLENAKSELNRLGKLKETNSIATRRYEEADFLYRALTQELLKSKAEIEHLKYEIGQKTVIAPFAGFVAEEHTQVGEWIKAGGSVATLHDLGRVRVTADVPERFVVMLAPNDAVKVLVKSISRTQMTGKIYAVLPQGNPSARTFPVRINMSNPGYNIKSGMEALVTFNLSETKHTLVVPKDAVVAAGNKRLVYSVIDGKAVPVVVNVIGYYDGDVAVEGSLKPGTRVVVRGNERLRPGVPVQIQK